MDDTVQKAAGDQTRLTKNSTPTLVDDVEEFEEKQNDYQAAYNAGGHFKEQLEAISKSWREPPSAEAARGKEAEVTAVTEVPTSPEIEPGVETAGYIERIEKEAELASPVVDEYHQILVGAAAPQHPQVKIPLTNTQIQAGVHHRVWEAIYWLAEWCIRQMKMLRLKHA